MVRPHLQWLAWLHHRPSDASYAVSAIWGRICPDGTFSPLGLWKDSLGGIGKISEGRVFCAPNWNALPCEFRPRGHSRRTWTNTDFCLIERHRCSPEDLSCRV